MLLCLIPSGKKRCGRRKRKKAEPKDNPFAPRPKALAIRYRKKDTDKATSKTATEDVVTIQEEGQDDAEI